MTKTIDYFISLNSPWTYMGGERFIDMAARHGATVTVRPVNFGAVFAESGGLPLPKRAPQRQAYRMMELKRWRDHLGIPLTLEPKYFPVDETLAAHMVIAARQRGDDALGFSQAILRALWAEERDTGDRGTLMDIARSHGLDADAVIAMAESGEAEQLRRADTQEAIDRQVFGAPSYVYRDEIFWGQDRLEFLDRALAD
jgi:2-hydroxychromene-2-carboxylate isomerase